MEEEKEKLNLHKQDVKACMEIERALYDLTDAANFFAPFESLEKFIAFPLNKVVNSNKMK